MKAELAKKCANKTIALRTDCYSGFSGSHFCVKSYEVQNSNGERIDEPLLNRLGMNG